MRYGNFANTNFVSWQMHKREKLYIEIEMIVTANDSFLSVVIIAHFLNIRLSSLLSTCCLSL